MEWGNVGKETPLMVQLDWGKREITDEIDILIKEIASLIENNN